jgi:hypothetical protein
VSVNDSHLKTREARDVLMGTGHLGFAFAEMFFVDLKFLKVISFEKSFMSDVYTYFQEPTVHSRIITVFSPLKLKLV